MTLLQEDVPDFSFKWTQLMVMISNRPNPNEAFPNPNIPPNTTAWPSRTCLKTGNVRDASRGRRSLIGHRATTFLGMRWRSFSRRILDSRIILIELSQIYTKNFVVESPWNKGLLLLSLIQCWKLNNKYNRHFRKILYFCINFSRLNLSRQL